MFTKLISTAALVAIAAVQIVSAISTIEAVGSKFFTSDGHQFYIKGNNRLTPCHVQSVLTYSFQALPTN